MKQMDNELLMGLLNENEPLEPETLYQLFPNLSPQEVQRLQVIKLAIHTNHIHEDMDVFENAVHAINGLDIDIYKTEGCKPEWIWFAVQFLERVKHREYSDEVLEYIKWNYNDSGIKFYPPMFPEEMNPLLQDVIYKAVKGPFPLQENFLDIQALHYLKIQEYVKNKI